MSISSFTTVMMLDSRPSRITISVPKSTDIMNRIITFKDLYGSASNSTIVLVTRSGDTFEDGTFSTIMSNAYQTVNLYAGQPGKWLNVGATGGGGDSANFTTVSNRLNGVSTNVTTISTNLDTLSNRLNGVSTNVTTISTNLNTVSNNLNTVSNNLTTVSNTVAAGLFPSISTNTISTNLIRAGYVSSPQGYISSLIVDSLAFSLSNSFIVMGDIITTSVSTIQTFTSSLTTNNLKVGTVSSLNYIAFSGLQQGYAQTVIAEQATATGIQELLVFKGSTNTDRIRMQTTGPIVFEPGVSARVFPNTGSNATPAMIINTSSNVGIGIAAPTVSLDVAGAGRFTAVSTQTISTMTLTVSNINGPGDLPITAAAGCNANITGLYINLIANNVQFSSNFAMNSGTTAATYNLTAQNFTRTAALSTNSISTASITAGGTINITSPLTNCTGEIYASGGAIRIVGSSTTFDLWNYCSLTQVSGNLTINSYSNVTTTASSNININATSTIYISSGGNAINLSGNIDINNKNISNVNVTRTAALSTTTISTATLNVAGAPISGRLIISTINPQTNPAFIIIKNPNISYFYADYTNLTNYITISNYGAVSGDYINIVNTGNSGTPATFQVLDGSTGASTIIRYIYPGHAGVVAYSAGQWWPL